MFVKIEDKGSLLYWNFEDLIFVRNLGFYLCIIWIKTSSFALLWK
jgi:hypothetical protein